VEVYGDYEIESFLGKGSIGKVYLARHRRIGRRVALKTVHLEHKFEDDDDRGEFYKRLQREAELCASMQHPNIVTLYDVGSSRSGPYLVLELLRGETLHEVMRRGPVSLRHGLEIAIEIAWALDHAHAAGVVHRDLKPANVFVCSSGVVKVLDFGIASVFGGEDVRSAGTPAYMAPEQWRQGKQGPRTDVYAAAVILCELVTGRLPYRVTRDTSAALEPGALPLVEAPGLPEEVKALLRRALAADPAERPPDGHAWLNALLALQERIDRPSVLETWRGRLERPGPRSRAWLLALAAGTIAAGGALLYGLLR
jgi:serine/threonine protein kinase